MAPWRSIGQLLGLVALDEQRKQNATTNAVELTGILDPH